MPARSGCASTSAASPSTLSCRSAGERLGRLAQALIVVVALGIFGCGATDVNSRQPSPPPARPCSFANPGVTPSPGGADASCGFQLGSELTGLDCSGNPVLPDGLTVEHADAHLNPRTAPLGTGSGGCRLPDAGQDEE